MDNLLSLNNFDTNNIISNLLSRYKEDIIYTYAGKILIAINPFKNTIHYSNEVIEKFLLKNYSSPHLYELANDSINCDENRIAFLISGESGSGKTESTKRLLNYFSNFYRDTNNILPKILDFNCILEAFGNATTLRNHNSSRFGKFIKVNINSNGEISAQIKTYLLEKVRVISENLSNYHIFYSFGYGINRPEYLDNAREDWDSNYLLRDRLREIWIGNGLGESYWEDIEKIIYLIIGLLENKDINKLDFISKDDLNNVLSYKTINTGDEVIKTELSVGESKNVMHTIVMTLYDKLFEKIVLLINEKLGIESNVRRTFGILDIFGFEVFGKNCFEQLCINYTNERLQSIFNKYVFEEEIRMFEEEGILKSRVTFETNSHILEFFDKKVGGFFSLLDEKSILNANDSDLERSLLKNDRVIKYKIGSFVIKHYAEDVEYDWGDFSLKNVERLNYDILEFCNKIYKNINIFQSFIKKGGKRGSIGNITITNQFRHSLNLLIDELDKSKLYFIRCIKPNDLNKPMNWEEDKVVKQLNYCGIVSALELARQSFPVRMLKDDFKRKYEVIYLKDSIDWDDWIKSLDYGDFLVGKSRLFYTREREKELNRRLIEAQKELIQKLIYVVRGRYYNLIFRRKLFGTDMIIRNIRCYLSKKELIRRKSILLIGRVWRGHVGREEYRERLRKLIKLQRKIRERYKRKRAIKEIKIRIVGYLLRRNYVSMILEERNSIEGIIKMREEAARYEVDKIYREKVELLEKRVRELEKYEGLYNDLSCLINTNNDSMIQSRLVKTKSNESLPLIGEDSILMEESLLVKDEHYMLDWQQEKLEYINAIQNLTSRVNYEFDRVQEVMKYYDELQYDYQQYKADIREAQILMSEKMYKLHNENIVLREENIGLVREMRGKKNWIQKLFF